MGVRENEDADIAAKAELDVAITNMRFPVGDLLTCVNQLCVKECQQLWNQCTSNKLYSVQPAVAHSVSSSLGRYDSVVIKISAFTTHSLTHSALDCVPKIIVKNNRSQPPNLCIVKNLF